MSTKPTPLQTAIARAGSQRKLAEAIGVAHSFVPQLLSGHRPIPEAVCKRIEEATGVTCEELRPDVLWVRYDSCIKGYMVNLP
jgi:DNA-binding transcriptional regulator YdaS (Cro superfamily)